MGLNRRWFLPFSILLLGLSTAEFTAREAAGEARVATRPEAGGNGPGYKEHSTNDRCATAWHKQCFFGIAHRTASCEAVAHHYFNEPGTARL